MDSKEIRRLLESSGHMEDVAEIRVFKGSRKNRKGEAVDVTVEIFDMGPSNPQYRYDCVAVSDTGVEARGNGGASLDETISIVHWNKLD